MEVKVSKQNGPQLHDTVIKSEETIPARAEVAESTSVVVVNDGALTSARASSAAERILVSVVSACVV